jgi:hypothetical protein
MGCDYYIIKVLHIYYRVNENEDNYLEVEINRERCYYDDYQFDEDSDDYDDNLNKYIEDLLLPKAVPIVIYNNNKFNKSSCECKYKTLVENEVAKYGKKWCEVTKIVKVEKRHEN